MFCGKRRFSKNAMDYRSGLYVTLLFVFSTSPQLTQGLPCGEAESIAHGNVKYFSAGRLVQYFCDSGYFPHGSPMLSCLKGRWKGRKPICVAPGCRRLVHPVHSTRTVLLNGAVLRHQCGEGFRMEGEAVLYCNGREWSGVPPTCHGTTTPALPAAPMYPPENAIEDPGNETLGIADPVSSSKNTGERRRPIFVSSTDKAPVFHPGISRVVSLFRKHGSDGDDDVANDGATRYTPPPRKIQMPPAIHDQRSGNQNVPHISPRISQPGYSYVPPARDMRPPQFNPFGRYNYGRYQYPQSPYVPRPYGQPIYPRSFISSGTIMRPVLLNHEEKDNPRRPVVPMEPVPIPTESGDASEVVESVRQGGDRDGFLFGNVGQPSVVQRGGVREYITRTPEKEDRVAEGPPAGSDSEEEPQPSSEEENRNVIGTLQSEVPAPEQEEENQPRNCPPAKKPMMGYFTTRPLPRDHDRDKYLYLIEYHCFAGLHLVGGDSISHCTTKGKWTGTVPKCEKKVTCDSGYIKQFGRCIDVDECVTDNGGCPQKCVNFRGGFRCRCHNGFELSDDNTCTDIDECSPTRDKICNHFCHNTPGSFSCTCRVGYTVMQDNRTCLDVNECLQNSPCDHLCQNTFGSFRCACKTNFRLDEDGRTCSEVCQPGYVHKQVQDNEPMMCTDEDECMEHGGLFNCEQVCNNTDGSYFCSCLHGYTLNEDGQTCSDLDECEELSQCEYGCINTIGSYSCSCPEAQVLSEDGLACVGCKKDSYMENWECVPCPENTVTEGIGATSSEECICKPGYRGNPSLNLPCTDVDECQDANYGCSHDCVNIPGSVFCECPEGFTLGPDGRNCQDLDECSQPHNPCKRGGLCRNTDGGYNCTCIRGFRPDETDPKVCVDYDECQINNGGCQGRCHNLPAGYRCSCHGNSRLDRDGRTCIPLRGSCPHLEALVNGRVLPEAPCIHVKAAVMGRACFYFCNGGYRLTGSPRRQCGPDGWTGDAPECVAKSQCPPLVVSVGVRTIPPTCATSSSLPWRMCVFSCEDQRHMMKGNRATRCIPARGWEHKPPTCVARSSAISNTSAISAIPRIRCPHDIEVHLAPGQSVARMTIAKPISNMEITEQRNDGSTSRDIFPAGITSVKFTAFTADRHRQASCVMRVHVRDKEAPTIQRCPGSIHIESTHEFPEISWQPPLFRDNVEVAKVKESRYPAGNITWGTYSVSYTASDAAGNMAECAFTIIIKRPKTSQKQGIEACGEPEGPANGQASCNTWARGVYCVPRCNPGFAFERVPPAYVCDQEGIWTPGRVIPDCIDMRSARQRHRTATAPLTTTTPITTTITRRTATSTTTTLGTTASSSTTSYTRVSVPERSVVIPKIRVLNKPSFYLLPTEETIGRSRKRPPPAFPEVRNVVRHGVSQPRLIQLAPESKECPRGQVPEIAENGDTTCVGCPVGHYRPRTSNAVECVPCAPGFYQDRPGKAYCSVCPNYVQGPQASIMRGREELIGLTSRDDCERITAILGQSGRSSLRRTALARHRRRPRHR